jgi:hypothetical protein
MHRSQQVQLEEALSGRAVERRAFAGKVEHTYVNFTIWSQFLCYRNIHSRVRLHLHDGRIFALGSPVTLSVGVR